MSKGVIYLTWGERAMQEAQQSIASLRRFIPDLPVLTLGNYKSDRLLEYINPFDEAKFLWGRFIPFLYAESPFDRTMYLDADTEFVSFPKLFFDWLDLWDFIVVETPERSLESQMVEEPEMEYSRQVIGSPYILYHNGGAFFWRKCKEVERFFDLWYSEWLRFQSWDPQVSMLRALALSDLLFLTLPNICNCKNKEEAVFLHHRYGSQAAQKFVRSS